MHLNHVQIVTEFAQSLSRAAITTWSLTYECIVMISNTGIAAANEAVKKIIDSSTRPGEEETTCSSHHGAYEDDKHDSCEP